MAKNFLIHEEKYFSFRGDAGWLERGLHPRWLDCGVFPESQRGTVGVHRVHCMTLRMCERRE